MISLGICKRTLPRLLAALTALTHLAAHAADEAPAVTFEQQPGALVIQIDNRPFATYIYESDNIRRPFFANLHAPIGLLVTRPHPAKPEEDHGDMHPGMWMSFGDLGGQDFWRNKARTQHLRFIDAPKGGPGVGTFAVENAYR
ncbi:MAG: DUF6807 family protein, partial [Candidatus Hydrogenedentales bacterium]